MGERMPDGHVAFMQEDGHPPAFVTTRPMRRTARATMCAMMEAVYEQMAGTERGRVAAAEAVRLMEEGAVVDEAMGYLILFHTPMVNNLALMKAGIDPALADVIVDAIVARPTRNEQGGQDAAS